MRIILVLILMLASLAWWYYGSNHFNIVTSEDKIQFEFQKKKEEYSKELIFPAKRSLVKDYVSLKDYNCSEDRFALTLNECKTVQSNIDQLSIYFQDLPQHFLLDPKEYYWEIMYTEKYCCVDDKNNEFNKADLLDMQQGLSFLERIKSNNNWNSNKYDEEVQNYSKENNLINWEYKEK